MTAQVAFFTSAAAVLATDSAVTVGGQKVYQGAQKVFPLSDAAPLGALLFGNARLLDVPWATLLGMFRSQHRNHDWSSLSDLVSAISSFIDQTLADVIAASDPPLWHERIEDLWGSITAAASHGSSTSDEPDLEAVVSREHDAWQQADVLPRIAADDESAIHDAVRDEVKDLLRSLVDESEVEVQPDVLDSAVALALLTLTRCSPQGSESVSSSGLVIAGFPAGALGPSYTELVFDGVSATGIRMWPVSGEACLTPGDVKIRAFAQHDGYRTLIDGVHPWYWPLLAEQLEAASVPWDKIVRAFNEADDIWYRARAPRLQLALNTLPVPALCEIAESFVSITGLLQRISGSLETVGGPVSVAVLSPGAPLRWMRRPSDSYGY